ncbi:hypothetical protein ACGC1H_002734 [Rhizoctonia solani]
MSGKMPEIIPPPPPKPVSPPNSAQGIAGLSYSIGSLFDLANFTHSPFPSLSPVVQGVNELGGHPPPPPPHSPPPPNPKSARLHGCELTPNVEASKPGYPPPPPPHSPPPPPPPRLKNEDYAAMATVFMSPAGLLVALIDACVCDARIYSTKAMTLGGNAPKPPRPHPVPVSPPPPPPRVDINNKLGTLTDIGSLCSQTVKFGTDLLPQGGHRAGLVVSCV